ncbi:hypothetical protein INR49_004717 [Caranx melampygus]|nr:hypothetical protein INR49_004717 [Caranx melampygus]
MPLIRYERDGERKRARRGAVNMFVVWGEMLLHLPVTFSRRPEFYEFLSRVLNIHELKRQLVSD